MVSSTFLDVKITPDLISILHSDHIKGLHTSNGIVLLLEDLAESVDSIIPSTAEVGMKLVLSLQLAT